MSERRQQLHSSGRKQNSPVVALKGCQPRPNASGRSCLVPLCSAGFCSVSALVGRQLGAVGAGAGAVEVVWQTNGGSLIERVASATGKTCAESREANAEEGGSGFSLLTAHCSLLA